MSTETRTRQKRTDNNHVHRDRSYHVVPADWMRLGRDEPDCASHARFFAEKICYEQTVEADPTATYNLIERNKLYVAYRNPETGDRIERTYKAAVIESESDLTTVLSSEVDGDVGPNNWGPIAYPGVKPEDNLVVIPKCVHRGEPRNFRASVMVSPTEPRIGSDR